MQIQLNSLIEKIKKEGILEARKNSGEIIKQAEEKRTAIIKQAENEAGLIIKQAQEKADRLKDNSRKAVVQAVRDASLRLKEEVKNLFDAVLKKEIQLSLSDEVIKELVLRVAEAWLKHGESGLEISLNRQDADRLENFILSKLKTELASGVTFKINPGINKGLYISKKGDDFHYDFTDEVILEILKEYLRPFIVKIIDKKESK